MNARLTPRITVAISSVLAALTGLACGSTPAPRELLDARSAYLRAQDGPATQLKPDGLHEAKVALDRAEKSYSDDPGAEKTRDLSYVAERKAELADVQARDAKSAMEKAQAEKDLAQVTQSQLSQARQQLSSADQQLSGAQQALATEHTARKDAEKRAHDAMDRLAAASAGNIKQESRGTVITIPGSVLFASGKTALLPTAQTKLGAVADALKDQTDHKITIEGHTDSQGSDASNMELSRGRAQTVKDYLVSRGVPADNIKSEGLGSSRPVADNKSTEGRANNRRVEIIVEPLESK